MVTPDGKFLFVTAAVGDRVERFSIGADGSPTALGTVTVDAPRGAAISPDGASSTSPATPA